MPAAIERCPLRQISTTGPVHARDFLHLSDEMRIDVPVGAVVPGDVMRAARMADEQVLHLAAAIDEDGLRVLVQEVAGFHRFQVFHRRRFRVCRRAHGAAGCQRRPHECRMLNCDAYLRMRLAPKCNPIAPPS